MLRRLALAAVVAVSAVLLMSSAAVAHALIRSSDPADGALLQQAPGRVLITFTEEPDPSLSVIHVLDQSGRAVEAGKAERVPGRPLELTVPLKQLPNGVYTVSWRVVSRVDGHVTAGAFSFGVGVSPAGARPPAGSASAGSPSPSVLAVAGRWAFYWGLALLMGSAVVGTVILRGLPPGGRVLIGIALAERSAVGVSLGQLLDSGAGRELIGRGVALLVVGAAVGTALVLPRWTSLPGVAAATAGAMFVHALAGHAGGEQATVSRWFDVGVQWVHLVAVGIWIGGLAWLLLAIRTREGPDRGAVIRRFSWLAGVALLVVAVTGTIRAVNELGGTHALRGLLHTSFGVALLVKVGLFAALVALGARNRYVNVPRAGSEPRRLGSLRRTVAAEILIAAGVLGATAVLSELPPASVVAAAARPTRAQEVVVTGSDFATSVRIRLSVSPGTVGPNVFSARVTDYDTGRPVPAKGVSLTFTLRGRPDFGSSTLDLSRGRGAVWSAQGTAISLDGTWDISALVQEPAAAVQVPMRFVPRLPPETIQVSRAPGQPTVFPVALAGGDSVQAYVDPGGVGNNTVHFTFFEPSGNEQPIASATATATSPSGATEDLPLTRFDAGHFVANTSLVPGSWRFRVRATTSDGTTFDAYFTQRIGS